MATRRRTSAVKSTTAKKSPRSVVTKKTTVTPQSVNKVTQIEEVNVEETADMIEIKLPEGTNLKKRPMNVETASKDTLNLEKLFKDYPRDGFALALLPLLLLEALTKEGLKLAGVIS